MSPCLCAEQLLKLYFLLDAFSRQLQYVLCYILPNNESSCDVLNLPVLYSSYCTTVQCWNQIFSFLFAVFSSILFKVKLILSKFLVDELLNTVYKFVSIWHLPVFLLRFFNQIVFIYLLLQHWCSLYDMYTVTNYNTK